jgi:phosphate transport system permease protein
VIATPSRQRIGGLQLSRRKQVVHIVGGLLGEGFLFLVTSLSTLAVLFIFFYIARDAVPFFKLQGFKEFFTSAHWYPSGHPAEFGALAIFYGSAMVTLGAVLVAVPMGILAAVCLSDILPFALRQVVKPVIEILAAIPSVAYGFFALVVLAPALQRQGGTLLTGVLLALGIPLVILAGYVIGDLAGARVREGGRRAVRILAGLTAIAGGVKLLTVAVAALGTLAIASGTNALNVSLILGIMALPTIVSVSEDSLQAVGRDLREGSYALGATRAETLLRVVIPAAASGIGAAVILGVMRAIGETMVVWMASGNASQIPQPWYNVLQPVRTLTATIAGDMGEADHVTGSARYHVLFAMALVLLVFSLLSNMTSEFIVRRARRRMGGA